MHQYNSLSSFINLIPKVLIGSSRLERKEMEYYYVPPTPQLSIPFQPKIVQQATATHCFKSMRIKLTSIIFLYGEWLCVSSLVSFWCEELWLLLISLYLLYILHSSFDFVDITSSSIYTTFLFLSLEIEIHSTQSVKIREFIHYLVRRAHEL